jgi:hypothetical protein
MSDATSEPVYRVRPARHAFVVERRVITDDCPRGYYKVTAGPFLSSTAAQDVCIACNELAKDAELAHVDS